MAQGKQGIWLSLFPDRGKHREFRYNTGENLDNTGNFPDFPENEVFYSKFPFHQLVYPQFFSSLARLDICPQTFIIFPTHLCLVLSLTHET